MLGIDVDLVTNCFEVLLCRALIHKLNVVYLFVTHGEYSLSSVITCVLSPSNALMRVFTMTQYLIIHKFLVLLSVYVCFVTFCHHQLSARLTHWR